MTSTSEPSETASKIASSENGKLLKISVAFGKSDICTVEYPAVVVKAAVLEAVLEAEIVDDSESTSAIGADDPVNDKAAKNITLENLILIISFSNE
ncbi:hypothetical protein WICMUC_003142 [Wickerhamomyces mucosus]|uniref:Uncharacterized protein n=1 Tax=Wickerhamomyces mucosus TaxID=1378264 RepID=A0A9P8TCZ7_9ASCO|nr:hypothetical protein WICMUC_003142 [Wickerhamomyces mucosus]